MVSLTHPKLMIKDRVLHRKKCSQTLIYSSHSEMPCFLFVFLVFSMCANSKVVLDVCNSSSGILSPDYYC